jgi:outer membrane protein assembly factor BamB
VKWKFQTALENDGVIAGEVDGEVRVFLTSQISYNSSPPPHAGFLTALSSWGQQIFRKEADSGGISPFPNFLEPHGVGPSIFYASGPDTKGSIGEARLVSARHGQIIWCQPTTNQFYGNGCCVMADVDGDGAEELVYGDQAAVRCFGAKDGELKWVYDDHISICHGRMAFGDINGDGKPELVLGTEYANQDHSSSVLALDGKGNLLWRRNGIQGDMGSTPAVIMDVDGDGHPEILKVELDLLNGAKMPWSGLFCFRGDGSIKYRVDWGCGGMAVADLDGDGVPEAAGITDSRDGGSLAVDRNEIRCMDLATGKLKWRTSVARTWLGSQDPAIADLSGNGKLNILITTSNPSGYGYRKGHPAYGDAYVVNPQGRIVWKATLPDSINQPFVSDIDKDGYNEIILACHDGSVRCYATPGKPGNLWSVTGANLHRTYSVRPW